MKRRPRALQMHSMDPATGVGCSGHRALQTLPHTRIDVYGKSPGTVVEVVQPEPGHVARARFKAALEGAGLEFVADRSPMGQEATYVFQFPGEEAVPLLVRLVGPDQKVPFLSRPFKKVAYIREYPFRRRDETGSNPSGNGPTPSGVGLLPFRETRERADLVVGSVEIARPSPSRASRARSRSRVVAGRPR